MRGAGVRAWRLDAQVIEEIYGTSVPRTGTGDSATVEVAVGQLVPPNIVCYVQECVTASFGRAFAELRIPYVTGTVLVPVPVL